MTRRTLPYQVGRKPSQAYSATEFHVQTESTYAAKQALLCNIVQHPPSHFARNASTKRYEDHFDEWVVLATVNARICNVFKMIVSFTNK